MVVPHTMPRNFRGRYLSIFFPERFPAFAALNIAVFLLCFLLCAQSLCAWEFERRKSQFNKEFAYAVFPAPYSLPGVGNGIGVGGGAINIKDTYIDTYGVIIGGDVEGNAVGVADIHLIEQRLILDFGRSELNKAAFAVNYSRGMKGDEDPDEFNSAEISDSEFTGGQAVLTFAERMVEFRLQVYDVKFQIDRFRDKNGDTVVETENAEADTSRQIAGSFTLDFTDDRPDPRSGLRFTVTRNFPDDVEDYEVDFYVIDTNVTAFIPMLANSTWVFNYFESDSHVTRKGETDREVLAEKYGMLPCTPGNTKCEEARKEVLDSAVAENTYGSASSLGGNSRLRSFISMRYRGAHTRFLGSEFRWNLTDENTRFNIWFMQDLRTSVQMAFFTEVGTIADSRSDLWVEKRHSTGVGLRIVMGSGLVYRAEYAYGEEGGQFVLFFGYPWDLL